MDTNLLKIFISVADKQSISLAAKDLQFAQSNVTSRIKQLEKMLAVQLFHRVPKGVVLTPAGEKFYPHAIDIIRRVDLALREIQNFEQPDYLRVGSTESNAVVKIVPFLIQLHQKFPKMQLELFTGTTADVTEMILDYKVDLALIKGIPKHKDLLLLNQFDEQMALLSAKTGDIPNVMLVFKQGCAYRQLMQDYFSRQGNIDYKMLEFGSLETILGCVKAGMGRTILPMNVVEKLGYLDDLAVEILDKQMAYLPTCMVCRTDAVPSMKKFLQTIEL